MMVSPVLGELEVPRRQVCALNGLRPNRGPGQAPWEHQQAPQGLVFLGETQGCTCDGVGREGGRVTCTHRALFPESMRSWMSL